jgi:hypothetical protein
MLGLFTISVCLHSTRHSFDRGAASQTVKQLTSPPQPPSIPRTCWRHTETASTFQPGFRGRLYENRGGIEYLCWCNCQKKHRIAVNIHKETQQSFMEGGNRRHGVNLSSSGGSNLGVVLSIWSPVNANESIILFVKSLLDGLDFSIGSC